MTHMRYWAMTFAVAIGGAFMAIERFAFAPTTAVWIAFGVAVAAVVSSLAATLVALLRDNQAFSGLSAISALVAAWTVIATRAFTTPTALWLAFAGGVVLLALSLRALALHETTVERVVHQLDVNGSGETFAAIRRRGIEISGTMRSWLHWLGHTGHRPRRCVRRRQHVHLAARHRRALTPLARVRGRRRGCDDRARPAAGRPRRRTDDRRRIGRSGRLKTSAKREGALVVAPPSARVERHGGCPSRECRDAVLETR